MEPEAPGVLRRMAWPATVAAVVMAEPGHWVAANTGLAEPVARADPAASVVPGAQREAAEMAARLATVELAATVVAERLCTKMG